MDIKPENISRSGRLTHSDPSHVANKWVQIRVTQEQQDRFKAAAESYGQRHEINCAYTSWAKAVLEEAALRELKKR